MIYYIMVREQIKQKLKEFALARENKNHVGK